MIKQMTQYQNLFQAYPKHVSYIFGGEWVPESVPHFSADYKF